MSEQTTPPAARDTAGYTGRDRAAVQGPPSVVAVDRAGLVKARDALAAVVLDPKIQMPAQRGADLTAALLWINGVLDSARRA